MSRTVEGTHARFCIKGKKKRKKRRRTELVGVKFHAGIFSIYREYSFHDTNKTSANNSLSPSPSYIYPTPRWFFFTKAKNMLELTSRMAFLDMLSICYVIDKNRAKNQVGKNSPQTHNQIEYTVNCCQSPTTHKQALIFSREGERWIQLLFFLQNNDRYLFALILALEKTRSKKI